VFLAVRPFSRLSNGDHVDWLCAIYASSAVSLQGDPESKTLPNTIIKSH